MIIQLACLTCFHCPVFTFNIWTSWRAGSVAVRPPNSQTISWPVTLWCAIMKAIINIKHIRKWLYFLGLIGEKFAKHVLKVHGIYIFWRLNRLHDTRVLKNYNFWKCILNWTIFLNLIVTWCFRRKIVMLVVYNRPNFYVRLYNIDQIFMFGCIPVDKFYFCCCTMYINGRITMHV